MEKHRYFSQFYKYQYPKGEKKNTVSSTVVDYIKKFLAYQLRKSEVFAWDRNSYPPMGEIKKETFHVNSVCIGCIGRHVTLLLG